MSSSRETMLDLLKTWKFLVWPTITIKPIDLLVLLLKTILAIFIVSSVSLFLYFAFSRQPLSLSSPAACNNNSVRTFYQQKFITENNSGQAYERTNLSHILFGIGGSAKTWNQRNRYSELWWRPNVTRGFVWLDEKPPNDESLPPTSPPYKISQDTSRFKYTSWYGSRSAVRMARIVKESFELGLDNVRWFVMGDDDTVFFLENLVTVLDKYDHNQMYYIGGNSESVEQDVIHSYNMAYGGGGFAISYPLAAELVKVLDGCIDRYASFYGSDQKVQGCMSGIGIPATKELGFHQVDIRGNPYGLLAAHPLAPLVSLHHLDYVQSIFPGMTQIDSLKKLITAYEKDPSRVLQQSFCYDLKHNWTVSVSWGYTLQLYPSLVTAKKLETTLLTFQSWRTWKNGPFTFNTRSIGNDPCERPVIYFLDRAQRVNGYRILTTYTRHVEESTEECNRLAVKFVNVSNGRLNPAIWRMVSNSHSLSLCVNF
ncbi:hypothetical protein DITRI_Ditri12bG0170800 [Diplodiscus trichospermus]